MVDPELQIQLEAVEREAYLDLYDAASPAVAKSLGLAVAETQNGVCTACSAAPDNAFMNRIRGLSTRRPPDDEVLEAAAEFFRSRPVGVFGVDVGPGPGRNDLIDRLTSRGFTHVSTAAKLVRHADQATVRREDSFDVVDVEMERAQDFASVWVAGLPADPLFAEWMVALPGRRGWNCKVAYRHGQAAACAASRIDEKGRCWLGYSATRPEHRRQGAQTALLADLLTQAEGLECTLVATEAAVGRGATATSLRNVVRAGFRIAYRRELYVSPVL